MSVDTPPSELLLEGIAAARAGETDDAVRLLRRVTELEPDNLEAWIWRADVAENSADKKAFLEEALRIDPGNAEARLALERVIEREGELTARAEDEPLFCTVHPDRETMLRCNRCGRPMCTECAVRHPVGLRCRQCVNELRSPIYQLDAGTLTKGFLAALAMSTLVGGLVLLFGGVLWFFFWIFIGGALGRGIASVVERATPRKRGKALATTTGVAIFLGLLLAGAGIGFSQGGLPGAIGGAIAALLQLHALVYLGTAIAAAVASLR